MNSDVSRSDSPTSLYSNSPAPTANSPTPSHAIQRNMRLRGSSNYHSIGLSTRPTTAARSSKDGRTSPTHATRVEKLSSSAQRKRDSARLLREKRQKALEREQALLQAEPETEEDEVNFDAIPVDSPASGVSVLGLRFPTLLNYAPPKSAEEVESQNPVKKQDARKPNAEAVGSLRKPSVERIESLRKASLEKVESVRSSITELDEKENE